MSFGSTAPYLTDHIVGAVFIVISDPNALPLGGVHSGDPANHVVLIGIGDIVHQISGAGQISIGIVDIGESGLTVIALAGGAILVVVGIAYRISIAIGGGGKGTVVGQIGIAGK